MAYTEEELKKNWKPRNTPMVFTPISNRILPQGLERRNRRGDFPQKRRAPVDDRLAFGSLRAWQQMEEPEWPMSTTQAQLSGYFVLFRAQQEPKYNSIDEVDPELLDTFKRLGIFPGRAEKLAGVAVDIVMDSVSVATTFKKTLAEKGIIFCSISEAIKEHPELVRQYLGSVVPQKDNYYAALNSAVFSDGSFCYIPKGVRCPMELSTYFRINQAGTGQFERTLVVADQGSYVSYLEGCTAPSRDENQLHCRGGGTHRLGRCRDQILHRTKLVPGNKEGRGGVYNFVTKRGIAHHRAKISWTQVETGSAVTWKYPSCVLKGDDSVGEFYSIAVTNNHQQADTGTKMIHLGRNTRSTIISKGISAANPKTRTEDWCRSGRAPKGRATFPNATHC